MKIKNLLNNSMFYLLPGLIFTMIILIGLPVMAQDSKDTQSPYNFSSEKFTDETLGMTVKAPKGWLMLPTINLMNNLSAYSSDEIEKLEKMKKGLDKKKDAKKLKEIEKSIKDLKEAQRTREKIKTENEGFLSLFKATTEKGNTTCMVSAKAISLEQMDGITTGKSYLQIMQPPTGKQKTKFKTVIRKIGNIDFESAETKVSLTDEKTKKVEILTYRTYAAPLKGYMVIINTANSPQDDKSVSEFLKSISFR